MISQWWFDVGMWPRSFIRVYFGAKWNCEIWGFVLTSNLHPGCGLKPPQWGSFWRKMWYQFHRDNEMLINVDRVYIQLEIRVGPCWKFPLRCWVRLSAFPTEVRWPQRTSLQEDRTGEIVAGLVIYVFSLFFVVSLFRVTVCFSPISPVRGQLFWTGRKFSDHILVPDIRRSTNGHTRFREGWDHSLLRKS